MFKYFKNSKQFMLWLIENGVDLDLNESLKVTRSRFTFVTKDGEQHFHKKLSDMVVSLNKLLKGVKIDATKSSVKGACHYKIVLQDKNGLQQKETKEKEVQKEAEAPKVELPQEALDKIAEFSEMSKRDGKAALEEYARETFQVELDKRSTFDKMVEELKAKL